MELLLNDEQKLLRDSAETLVARRAGPARARVLRESGTGFDRGDWGEIAAAGWLAMLVPENAGGLGLGLTELALIQEQAGRGLLAAPICATAAAAAAIADGDATPGRAALLDEIIGGQRIVLPALHETAGSGAPETKETQVSAASDGLRLTGRKSFVPSAAGADGFLVYGASPSGPVLCHVPADAEGVARNTTRTVDGGAVGEIVFSDTPVAPDAVVAGPNRAANLAGRLNDRMLLGLSAELLGVMEQALDIALEYLKVREQFGRPIGSFQALQHRAVNDYASVEVMRSLLFEICKAADQDRFNPAMAAALKSKTSAAALNVTKSAIQMHGAIGFTDEHEIGLYLKRAMALSAQYGNEATQRARYARLSGIKSAAPAAE